MASFDVNGGKTTVNFDYTADTAKLQEIVGLLAESSWVEEFDEDGVVTNPFDQATNQEKLDAADTFLRRMAINEANKFKRRKTRQDAYDALTPLAFD